MTDQLILDIANECLWRGAEALPLRPKAFQLLAYMAANPRRILTKDELLSRVWPDAIVGDAVLKVCVRELRVTLGDDSKQPRFIETVHRRGYRFRQDLPTTDAREPVRNAGSAAVSAQRLAADRSDVREEVVCVARERELALLSTHLEHADRGRRQTVFVTGAPGIGKSTLVEAFLARIRGEGVRRTAHGQCLETFGTGEPYRPLVEAVARLCASDRDAVELLRRRAPAWLLQLPALQESGEEERLQREVYGATEERMLRELADFLEVWGRDSTGVLLLEDLHWADASTLDFLSHWARRREPTRILVLATYRPVEVIVHASPLRTLRADLERRELCGVLPLELFAAPEVERFLAARLETPELPAGLAAWADERTDGNPLFLGHLTEYLQEEQLLRRSDGAWRLTRAVEALGGLVPRSLRELLEQELEARTPDEQAVLEAASLAGREFKALAAAKILERDPLEVEECCARLVRAGLFLASLGPETLADGTVTERYRFLHSLQRDVLYERIPAARRTLFNRRYAEAGVVAYGEDAHAIAAELAVHFEAAGVVDQAVHFRVLAARNCAQRLADREAARHLEHALELAGRLPGAERNERRLLLHEELGIARRSVGDMLAAAAAFGDMAAVAEESSARERRVHALLYQASALSWIDRERCLACVRDALAIAAGVDDALLRAHAAGCAAYWELLWKGWRVEGIAAVEAAVDAARAAGDRSLESLHAVRLSLFRALRGDYAAAADAARLGLRQARRVGDTFDDLLGRYFLAWALLFEGRAEDMQQVLDEALEDARRNGHARWIALFELLGCWLRLETGRLEGTLERIEAAEASTLTLDVAYGQGLACMLAARALLEDDAPAAALERLETRFHADAAPFLMDWILELHALALRSRALRAAGDVDAARSVAEDLAARLRPIGNARLLQEAEQLAATT